MSVRELPRTRDRTPLAAGLDTFAVVLFVAIGRRNHNQDPGVAGLIETAAPFLIGLGISWLALRAWHHATSVRTGVGLWIGTVAIGMLLRRFVFDEGTATSFVVVATAFLGSFLVGWRLAVRLMATRRQNREHATEYGA